MKYYAGIGETVTINGITGKCVESDDCIDCVIAGNCENVLCSVCVKEDYKNVKFVKCNPKIYLSAPITGYEIPERREYFATIQKHFESRAFDVINPMNNGLTEDNTYSNHMRVDIKNLLECEYVYFGKGWEKSNRCIVEHSVAKACGMIMYFDI